MKKILCLILAIAMLVAMTGCFFWTSKKTSRYYDHYYNSSISDVVKMYFPFEIAESNSSNYEVEKDSFGRYLLKRKLKIYLPNGNLSEIFCYRVESDNDILFTYNITENWLQFSWKEYTEEEIDEFKRINCWNEPIEENPKMLIYDDYILYFSFQPEIKIKYDKEKIREAYERIESEVDTSLYEKKRTFIQGGKSSVTLYFGEKNNIALMKKSYYKTSTVVHEVMYFEDETADLDAYNELLRKAFADWKGYYPCDIDKKKNTQVWE